MVYKEPALAWSPQFVLDALPSVRIIHIYRDGRDCANSLVRTYDVLTDKRLCDLRGSEVRLGRPYDPTGSDPRYVPWWVDDARADTFMKASPYGRASWMWAVMVERCRNIFSSRHATRQAAVLEIRYEDLVSEPHTWGPVVLDFLGGTPSQAFEKVLNEARTTSIGSYKRRDPCEVAEAERIAGAQLDRYGYPASPVSGIKVSAHNDGIA
jgi:hypothetical protein